MKLNCLECFQVNQLVVSFVLGVGLYSSYFYASGGSTNDNDYGANVSIEVGLDCGWPSVVQSRRIVDENSQDDKVSLM